MSLRKKEISSNNSEKLTLLANKHLWTFLLHSSYARSRIKSHALGGNHIGLGPGQSSPRSLLSPNLFDCWEPVPEAKGLLVTLEKPTMSNLSVSARIRVIRDPFSQMKREYNTLLENADSANRNNFVPSQSFTWCSLGNLAQGDQHQKVNC